MQSVASDQAVEPQINACNTMLERKPVVMIIAAINSTNLSPCLKQATDKGIRVVDLDRSLGHAIAEKAGVSIAFIAAWRLGRPEGGQHHQRHADPQSEPCGDLLRQ